MNHKRSQLVVIQHSRVIKTHAGATHKRLEILRSHDPWRLDRKDDGAMLERIRRLDPECLEVRRGWGLAPHERIPERRIWVVAIDGHRLQGECENPRRNLLNVGRSWKRWRS